MKRKLSMLLMLPIMSMASGTYTIGNKVWHDSNQNWEQDSGEKGMKGVTVILYEADGEEIKRTTTDKKGKYHFYDVEEGDYEVKVKAAEGVEVITEPKLAFWLNKKRKNIDFGLYNHEHKGDYSIGNKVWNDSNQNWEQDNGEKGMENVTVNLYKASGEKVATTQTDHKGKYKFKNLAEDEYVVKVVAEEGVEVITEAERLLWLDKKRKDIDFGLYKTDVTSPPPPPSNTEPISLEKLKEMISNGEDVTKVNTSQITDMDSLFYNNKTFNQDISGWDVSNVTNMDSMFKDAISFNQPIGNWDVSKVTNMGSMFSYAYTFSKSIDNWNVSNVTNMNWMFRNATAFNQPIGNWDVSNVTNMNAIFRNATIFNQPIGNWNVSNVTIMQSMFDGAIVFNQPINNWNVSKVTEMNHMFNHAIAFNQPINDWNVSKVTSMYAMFFFAKSFNQPINNWNVDNVTVWNNIFTNATAIEEKNKPEKFK